MAKTSKPATQTPEQYLSPFPSDMQAIANELRKLWKETIPDAVEAVYPTWKLLGYRVPVGRKSAYVGFILPQHDRVLLGFEHGTLMDDPSGLLGGDTKQVKVVIVRDLKTLRKQADAIRTLIREGARMASLSKAERARLALSREWQNNLTFTISSKPQSRGDERSTHVERTHHRQFLGG